MKIKNKIQFIILFLFSVNAAVAQDTDSTETHGTITIKKKQPGQVYIKASARFFNYEYPKGYMNGSNGAAPQTIQPFPVVDGHTFPFNYSAYFYDKFKNVKIDLREKQTDTVRILIKVRYNGRVAFKDISEGTNLNLKYADTPPMYEPNDLNSNCLNFLTQIKEWYPAYFILPKKEKFKKQTVIVPYQEKINCDGIITIIFSTTPFDED